MMAKIVLPQAVRTVFPALGNYASVLIKESSLVAVISVYELMRAGEILAGATFRSMLVYSLVGLIYFVLCSAVSYLFRWGEKQLAVPGYWGSSTEASPLSRA
jgi:ABC-type amino acid transport system permease subunit